MSLQVNLTIKDQYRICRQRGHQKSGRIVNDGLAWEICKYCGSYFRWVTTLKEKNTPGGKNDSDD